MKKIIFYMILLLQFGCTDAPILCWYSSSGGEYFNPRLIARTASPHADVYGPIFKTNQEMYEYIDKFNLKMCGTNEKNN